MDKPIKKAPKAPAYDYHEVIDFIENKYGIQTRGYKRSLDGVYRDFWHWIIENGNGNVTNGSYIYLPKDGFDEKDWWAIEIMEMIEHEFPGISQEEIWVEW